MTEFDPGRENGHDGRTDTQLDERDARALTQYLSVLDDVGRARDADDLYLVVSESGSEYLVDARDGACECPDFEYRDARCKHLRRVAFATGERAIPAWIDTDAVDEQLGIHVDATPRVIAADGGSGIIEGTAEDAEILEDDESDDVEGPTYTYHRESPDVGGARYVKCQNCGRESVPADPDRLLHRRDCPESDRDDDAREEPTRSEPADFGGGESTGVQDL